MNANMLKSRAISVGLVCAGAALAQQPPVDIRPKAGAGASAHAATAVDPQVAIQRANEDFNSADTLIGDFVQTAADGRRAEGKLYIQRPGKMRFEYASPATLEVISDGTSVAVRDRKLNTQDLYLISQTPLKFLLKRQIDISRDTKVLNVASESLGTSIVIEDKATLGGTSRIKLVFDANFSLKQWLITDPQGYDTRVALFNVDRTRKPDADLFKINTERMLEPN